MTKNVEIRSTDDLEGIDAYHDAINKVAREFMMSLNIFNEPEVNNNFQITPYQVYAHLITTIILNISGHLGKQESGPLGFHVALGKIMLLIGEMLREGQDQLFPTTEEVH